MKYSEQELIDELHRVSEEHCDGETPTQKDMIEKGKYSAATYERRFNSWNDALEKTGVGVNVYKNYTKEELKEILIEFSKEYCSGEAPTRSEFDERGSIHYSTLETHFGTWNKALKSCGFDLNEKHDFSEEFLKEEIFRVKNIIGETPRIKDIQKYGATSVKPYENKFGGWNEALKACNMKYNHKNNIDKEYIKKEIKRVSEEYCDGKAPKRQEMQKHSDICQRTATINFGSWENVLEECGIEPLQPKEYLPTGEEHHAWSGGGTISYGPSWYSQRKKALERDGFNCRVCQDGEALIDVHHIKPVREWNVKENHREMNDLGNLVCLCRSCHKQFEGMWTCSSPEEFCNKAFSEISNKKT